MDHPQIKTVRGSFRPAAKKPCHDCPVRRVQPPGKLGGYSPGQYLAVMHGPANLACHTDRQFGNPDHTKQRSCTGLAIYRKNTGYRLRHMMDELAAVEPDTVNVFATPAEFYEHHAQTEPCSSVVE